MAMVDFEYKLQLHCNIYTLIFSIWMENIIKMILRFLGSCKGSSIKDVHNNGGQAEAHTCRHGGVEPSRSGHGGQA